MDKKSQSQPALKSKPLIPAKITEAEAKDALQRSGYLLESRVEAVLRRQHWYVETNSAYEDSDTKKSRELDIYALTTCRVGRDAQDRLFTSVLIECVNNPQPIAFITKTQIMRNLTVDDIKVVMDPEEVVIEESDERINIGDLIKIGSYHHYCKGRIATQFCSFSYKKDKIEWTALHDDVHFNAFDTLVKALEYKFTQFEWREGIYINWEFIHPVVVVQGELLDARVTRGTLELRKTNYAKYRRTVIWKGEERRYVIDVVTASEFPKYVALLETELRRTASKVSRHAEVIKATLRLQQAAKSNSINEASEGAKTTAPAIPPVPPQSAPD